MNALFLTLALISQPDIQRLSKTSNGGLSAVALDATEATRTIELENLGGKFATWKVGIDYTYSAATTVTATFECAYFDNYYRITSRAISSGASTVSLFADTYTTGSADADLELTFDLRGCNKAKIVFGGASADGSDLVNVESVLIRLPQ